MWLLIKMILNYFIMFRRKDFVNGFLLWEKFLILLPLLNRLRLESLVLVNKYRGYVLYSTYSPPIMHCELYFVCRVELYAFKVASIAYEK
jgi:hypothetical protein